jgi:two-component system chemotaxis sensor kinase CheA
LAKKLGKAVELEFTIDDTLMIPKDLAKKLNANLGHLYRNCIDHGIELPEERENAGKSATGKIDIQIEQYQAQLQITIADDGNGIDNQKISQLAINNPKLDQKKVSEIIENETYWQLLFLPGFSSAETVTDGMDAVMHTINDLNGEITLNSQIGKGTEITITVPNDLVS